ncbi:MAG: choice-of-anchor B family protein [Rhodothermaceae bacterium]|nr:choice-of-anchor B family protein [Rhodothermaceae bacterium]
MTFRLASLTRVATLSVVVLWATAATAQPTPCTDGHAGAYACEGMDLYAHVSLDEFGSTSGNDIWGWTDPETGREYALMGLRDGTGIVDVTEPGNVAYLGKLPTSTEPSLWRDIKVYQNYAFVVSEAPGHGMQIFDLTQLRGLSADADRVFEAEETFVGPESNVLGSAHNIVMNEDSGYAYAVGAEECAGGLYMINVQDPLAPAFEGCFDADGYSHDAQCVMYEGPDEDYAGSEICVGSNEDTITIVDVTDKSNPVQLGQGSYPTPGYTHQGWFTEDHRYFIVNDELDEIQGFSDETRTFVFDLSDLGAPELQSIYTSGIPSADHNMYVLGTKVYQANYASGLRVLDLSAIWDGGEMTEVASFDIYPETDDAQFNGAWSVYPYFPSGTVAISGIEGGLFVVRPGESSSLTLGSFEATATDGDALVTWTPSGNESAPFMLQGRRAGEPFMTMTTMEAGGSRSYRYEAAGLSPGRHEFRVVQLCGDAICVSDVTSVEVAAPENYRLSEVMMDGAMGTSQVSLTLAQAQQVQIHLLDADGNHLKTIADDMMEANMSMMFEVGGPGLPAGTYTVRIEGETFEDARTITRAP